jgi:hypothetical protein
MELVMMTIEMQDEYTAAMEATERQREDSGPGLLVLIDAGELDMDALVALFTE